jgi:hypothetical protein
MILGIAIGYQPGPPLPPQLFRPLGGHGRRTRRAAAMRELKNCRFGFCWS